jgi:hypothetical protein
MVKDQSFINSVKESKKLDSTNEELLKEAINKVLAEVKV